MSINKIIDKIESEQLASYPKFSSGDTVEVSVKVKEGKRERIQLYEGIVIAKKIEVLTHLLLLEKYLMVKELREYFSYIARSFLV